MINKKFNVEQALSFSGPLPYVPKGELFIERTFIDEIFPQKYHYFEKFKNFISLLDIDLVGIFPYEKELMDRKNLKVLEEVFLVCNIQGIFSFLVERLGFIETFKAFRINRQKIFDITETFLKEFKTQLYMYRDLGFNGIAVVDDIAGNRGPFFSKSDFEEILKPVYSEMVKVVKSYGQFVFFHSDGNLERYLVDFVNMGFDCLHMFDAEAGMDIYRVKTNLQKNVCFMGHIDLLGWNIERIEREVKKAEGLFLSGGLILGSTTGLFRGILKEKIVALYPQMKGRIYIG